MAEVVEGIAAAGGGGEGGGNNGNNRFPVGFRFKPTDEELVEFYLLPRLQGRPTVPNDAIIEANVYKCNPQTLVYEKYRDRGEDAWYFLSPRARIYQKGARPARKTEDGCGRWKSSSASKVVDGVTIGDGIKFCKNVLNYFVGTPKNEERTSWLMREFTIPEFEVKPGSNSGSSSGTLDEYVMYKIYLSPVHKDEPGTGAVYREAGEQPRTRKRARQRSLTIGRAQASGAGNVSVPAQAQPTTYNALVPVQRPPMPMQFPTRNAATTYYPNFSGQTPTMTRPPNLGLPAPGTGFRPHVSLNCYYDHNYRAVQQWSNAVFGMPPQQRPTAFPPRPQQQPCLNGNANDQAGGVSSQGPPQQRPMAFAPPPPLQQIMYFNGNGSDQASSSSRWPPYNNNEGSSQAVGEQSEATSSHAESGLRSRGGDADVEYRYVDLASINSSLARSHP